MIDLLVDLGAVHRVTRLVTADDITAPLRDALIRWAYHRAGRWEAGVYVDPDDMGTVIDDGISAVPPDEWTEYAIGDPEAPRLARLISCKWCASVYVAAGVVALRRLAPRFWSPVATALALSSASTLLAALED